MKKSIREDFCPVCIMPVVAAAGGGLATGGILTTEEKNKRTRKILIWTGISVVLSVVILFFWIKHKNKCKTCKL